MKCEHEKTRFYSKILSARESILSFYLKNRCRQQISKKAPSLVNIIQFKFIKCHQREYKKILSN